MVKKETCILVSVGMKRNLYINFFLPMFEP